MVCLGMFMGIGASLELRGQDIEEPDKLLLDSLFIMEVEDPKLITKVLHAEPLFIDLIRDLGARKGEKEWNIGLSLIDNKSFDQYRTFVEYEFAPINRLGLEAEVTFDFFYPSDSFQINPGNRMTSLKLALQHSFWVSDQYKTTLAWGYLNETEFVPFKEYGKKSFVEANIYNPFFIAAKRWGSHFHTLVLAGPEMIQDFGHGLPLRNIWQINTNFHYMISGTRNFVGLEVNKLSQPYDFDMTLRPQIRVSVTEDLLIGIVTGIPVFREEERFSSFIRIIYEPPHKKYRTKKKHK